jgi:selenide, water dikinase
VLRPLKEIFPPGAHRDLLVGLEHPDDAAVWKISPDRAVVFTADFFTPIVDTPYEFGAIAAANAVSDVYAMGGEPILALNLCAFPTELPASTVREIIRGGAEKIREAGAVLAGGHSIRDAELKFGMAVVGFADPGRIMTKNHARLGDRLDRKSVV